MPFRGVVIGLALSVFLWLLIAIACGMLASALSAAF